MVLPVAFRRAASRAVRLGDMTGLRVGGTPEYFFSPSSDEEVAQVIAHCHREGIPFRVLGGGYNLLVSDGPIAGAVIATRGLRRFAVEDRRVVVGAGTPFPGLVARAAALRIPVLPGCPGIPGNVGGVVAMNAGGRFGCVGDALVEVMGVDRTGRPYRHAVRKGDFAYRRSVFQGTLVTTAVFRRDPTVSPDALQGLHAQAKAWKQQTQPLSAHSAGCVFKNPDGPEGVRSAGRLIDEAGLKGRTLGGAMVSMLHANFIVNAGGATAADVRGLIRVVQDEVEQMHGVRLELEVQSWE